jgi:2-polyprenyl-6-methoxyphenol hydroxylase-like FAD-dependent oxidoreductase
MGSKDVIHNEKILIVGAGIAGLMIKNRLESLGYSSILCESANELRADGAGLLLGANVTKIFREIGLEDKLLAKSQVVKKINSLDNNNLFIGELDMDKVYKDTSYKTLTILRQDLFDILIDSIDKKTIWLSHKLTSIEKQNNTYKVQFNNDKYEVFDKIIATDGLFSKVRGLIFGEIELRHTNQACWRFIVNTPKEINSSICSEMWGNQKRIGIFPLSKNKTYCFLVATMQGEEEHLSFKEVLNKFDEFSGDWLKIKPMIDISKTSMIYGELADAKKITLQKDGIVFMGDSAHSTTPNMGQGAAMGIESAYIFSELLKNSTFDEAVAQYEKQRYNKVNSIREKSMIFGKVAHIKLKFIQKIRNFILRIIPNSVSQKQFENAIFE